MTHVKLYKGLMKPGIAKFREKISVMRVKETRFMHVI